MIQLIICNLIIQLAAIFAQTPGTWQHYDTYPTGNAIRDLEFANADTGWLVTEPGEIFRTNDGGTSWTLQYHDPATGILDILMLDTDTGYAVGWPYLILKTHNGGANWFNTGGTPYDPLLISNNPNGGYSQIEYKDGLMALSVGSVIFKYGNTYNNVGGYASAIDLVDSTFLFYTIQTFVSPAGIAYNDDKGQSTYWKSYGASTNLYLGQPRDLHFFDRTNGFMAGHFSKSSVIHITDTGQTWTNRSPDTTTFQSWNRIDFFDDSSGVLSRRPEGHH